ncbi:MAG: PKD domain-containing protein, partial [Candidatus Thorarchaeota archaeon]
MILNSKIKKLTLAFTLLVIIVVSFFVSTPIPDYEFHIIEFSINNSKDKFRTNYPIIFNYTILGTPSKIMINWGDRCVETITTQFQKDNGKALGNISHAYTLQGLYSPKIQIWDYYGQEYSEDLTLIVQNDILPFEIDLNSENRIWEDQKVGINISSIYEINEEVDRSHENLTFLYDFSDFTVNSNDFYYEYCWENEGVYNLTISAIDSQGIISRKVKSVRILNKPPEAHLSILTEEPYYSSSEIEFSAESSNDTLSDINSLKHIWYWGDNSTSWGKFTSHTFTKQGVYNITLIVIDDNGAIDSYSQRININQTVEPEKINSNMSADDNNPFIAIGTLPENVYEDDQVQLICNINLKEGNLTDYTFEWSFGDGTVSFEQNPIHAWIEEGRYDIILNVTDINNNEYLRTATLYIIEKAPQVLGPFSFQGIEGQAITLDVEVYDAISDSPYLNYSWFDENGQVI